MVFNVSVIFIFKYLDFSLENINAIGIRLNPGFNALPLQEIALPLGISFFTFQQMSLLWDVYRDTNSERKITLLNTSLYISLFPQLVAGPIVRFNDIIEQIKSRKESIDLIRSGIMRFIEGLFKKIIIANSCGALADSIMDAETSTLSTPTAWLGIVAYTFQIYFDFSSYSDMAIGLGRMFGFRFLENFNFPYISRSIKEFWRRWHMSLSTWFRDYVYIPLGGNRKGGSRTYVNLLIVFLLTGFWHGATWSFVVWGLFHGIFLTIERLGLDKLLKKLPKAISWSYTILIVMLGWVLFRIELLPNAINYMGKLFGVGESVNSHWLSYLNRESALILVLATILATSPIKSIKNVLNRFTQRKPSFIRVLSDTSYICLFIIVVMYINSGSYNPFIYFRF